ncbi:MAG: hypothetical protein Q8R60_08825 [Mycobacteriales bacterium]|nr:hypothetical protein [Mycobacteriales bacterium]
MTASNSRGGPLTTDRPTAENPGEKFTANGTPRRRQTQSATHVLGTATGVVGGTGRHRYVVVYACPVTTCRRVHLAHVRGDLPAVIERPTACKAGRVALHPVVARVLGGAA